MANTSHRIEDLVMLTRLLVLLVVVGSGLAGCTQVARPSDRSTPEPASPAATVRPTSAAVPTPAFPAPAELQGTWRAVIGQDEVTLRIRETSYSISRVTAGFPATGNGRVEVDGDEIVFSGSNRCADDGDGRYQWAIDGDVLRFTSLAPDPCARPLDGVEYTRDG
jgi:hypothetical protein